MYVGALGDRKVSTERWQDRRPKSATVDVEWIQIGSEALSVKQLDVSLNM